MPSPPLYALMCKWPGLGSQEPWVLTPAPPLSVYGFPRLELPDPSKGAIINSLCISSAYSAKIYV